MSTTPVRIDKELFAEAQTVGARNSRSAAQQISHWAILGRQLENSADVSHRDVQRVLAGEMSYDALGDVDQAEVRAAWEADFYDRRVALNLADEFAKEGRSWVELDDDGNVVTHGAGSGAK